MDPLTRLALDAARGDHVATNAFIRATQSDVLRFVAYLADPQHAEDLAQETYLRALRGLTTYRGDAPAKAWLFAVARHVVNDWLRSRMRRPSTPVADIGFSADPHDFTGEVELLHLVAALAVERREAFTLTQIVGLSYEDAAVALDCPIGTVRSRVFRARADLAAALASQGDIAGASHAG